jgi:major membrane immunogen (membrane-anchored lipoprotein)
MKKSTTIFLVVVMAGFLLIGCGKQPVEDMNAAKSAVDAVIAEGAEKYAPEDAKMLNDELTAAMDEIKVQDGKMM